MASREVKHRGQTEEGSVSIIRGIPNERSVGSTRKKKPIYMSELQPRQKEMWKVRLTRVRARGGSCATTDFGQFYMDVNSVSPSGGGTGKKQQN